MLDAQGQVLRPAKLWCDTETASENQELLDALGGAQGSLERLGLVIAPGYTVSKLLWSKRHFPRCSRAWPTSCCRTTTSITG